MFGWTAPLPYDMGRILTNSGSYISRTDPRLHFGLNSCANIDRVTVTWPRGGVQVLEHLPVNRYTTVEEPR
jgi:hypothetical protein